MACPVSAAMASGQGANRQPRVDHRAVFLTAVVLRGLRRRGNRSSHPGVASGCDPVKSRTPARRAAERGQLMPVHGTAVVADLRVSRRSISGAEESHRSWTTAEVEPRRGPTEQGDGVL
jgi:hypothetical protein